MLFALSSSVDALQAKKIPQIGVLSGGSPSTNAAFHEAFQQGLHELEYHIGKNILIEYRYAEEKRDRFAELATELVNLKVDVILAAGATGILQAKKATSTIPIVMTNVSDPVALGFVASLARPGGNVTGLSTQGPELSGKRLELLKEIVANLSPGRALAAGWPGL
jgi:putative ABC transport system substrate-binding protein